MVTAIAIIAASLLGGGMVWAARDVARYRIDAEARREHDREALKHTTVAETRMERLEERVANVERIGVRPNGMVRR